MNQPPHKNTLMKTACRLSLCTVQSVTDHAGRRTVTFTHLTPRPSLARTPVKRRPAPFRLKILTMPEATFSFEPAVQLRARPRPEPEAR
jgi:hypothetical protein